MNTNWVAIGYNLPASPSKNRVYVWRKLKECGAEYFRQGVSVLPANQPNIIVFKKLAQRIRDMGGEATLIELNFIEEQDERDMVARFKEQSKSEYQSIIDRAVQFVQSFGDRSGIDDDITKLEKELERVRKRDHFGYGLTSELRSGLDTIFQAAIDSAEDFKQQLINTTGYKKNGDNPPTEPTPDEHEHD